MTQRQFDVEKEKDMQDLWNILPDDVVNLTPATRIWITQDAMYFNISAFNINWHLKTEITRPIQEATEADIDKICCFWDSEYNPNAKIVGCLHSILPYKDVKYVVRGGLSYRHCRRLKNQEIEELI